MSHCIRVGLLLFFFLSAGVSGISQLRNLSNYGQDCINIEKTYFVLNDTGSAEFVWASEWTHISANNFPEKTAMLVWNFKNGSKAYSRVIEQLGDAGGSTGYFLSGKSSTLEDGQGKSIQPMTRDNYPVKIELCLGEMENSKFMPDTLVDVVCLESAKIDYGHQYYFTHCDPEASK
jgi:hypothetical protein